jgi:hypothetical protein
MKSQRPPEPEPGVARPSDPPSDAEIRAIAERLVREHDRPPPASPNDQLSAPQHELSAADEERVDAALVDLGAADPEDTIRAEREAAGQEAPSPGPQGEPDGGRGGIRGN